MKSILLSIRPEWVEKILNGEKTIEVRKQFPKDYKGWVYIYCTKDKKNGIMTIYNDDDRNTWFDHYELVSGHFLKADEMRGKVVARFWCDKVEEIRIENGCFYNTDTNLEYAILEKSCLSLKEIGDYLGVYEYQKEIIKVGYAIHISKLEIFDEPRELSEFTRYGKPNKYDDLGNSQPDMLVLKKLTKAPQNYCYIEGDEY